MTMARYLCQLCNTIVHDSENHPCFIYKNEDEVYIVPEPNVSEELERKDANSEGTHAGDWNESNGNTCRAAQQNDKEECNETNMLPTASNEPVALMLSSRRKRSHSTMLSSEFLQRKKKRHLDSKLASSSNTEKGGNKAPTNKSKKYGKRKSEPYEILRIGDSSSGERATESCAPGSVSDAAAVSVAGPSVIRTRTQRNGKEKAFVCDVCGKAFARWDHLERHERTHTGDKPFVCKMCGKGFSQQAHLKTHLLTHTGEKPYLCGECDKGFAQQGDLTKHLLTHTGEKPFECDFCGKRFARKHHRDYHFRTHTGEQPYECKFCDKKFRDKSSCNNHQKKKHAGME